jgi:lysophospholipid acyltransferase (LPLAT)-like uncharacterized protein
VKRLLRSAAVQGLLAWLVSVYVNLTLRTMRWTYVNREVADRALAAERGGMALFWHGRIAFAMACREAMGAKPTKVMISLSRDGEFIAKAAERLGIPAIRGSAGRADRALSKGGATAVRHALSFIAEGGAVVMTPDGPRGPNQTLPLGPLEIARMAACQVWLAGLEGRPSLAFRSWDRAHLPLPFSRGCLVLEGPLFVDAHADADAMEATRAEWQARLRAVQARAEALLQAGR